MYSWAKVQVLKHEGYEVRRPTGAQEQINCIMGPFGARDKAHGDCNDASRDEDCDPVGVSKMVDGVHHWTVWVVTDPRVLKEHEDAHDEGLETVNRLLCVSMHRLAPFL
jgi:hypothetical protein